MQGRGARKNPDTFEECDPVYAIFPGANAPQGIVQIPITERKIGPFPFTSQIGSATRKTSLRNPRRRADS